LLFSLASFGGDSVKLVCEIAVKHTRANIKLSSWF